METTPKINEQYLRVAQYIDDIKTRINNGDYSEPIHKKMITLMKALSQINPFNNIIIDIYAEADNLDINRSDVLDPMKKGMILMKLDFWKEKLKKSMDIVEF